MKAPRKHKITPVRDIRNKAGEATYAVPPDRFPPVALPSMPKKYSRLQR